MRFVSCLSWLLLGLLLLSPPIPAQERSNAELQQACGEALQRFSEARAGAEALAVSLEVNETRLAAVLAVLSSELPAPPPSIETYVAFDVSSLEPHYEAHSAYLAGLEEREQLEREGRELVASRTDLLESWGSQLAKLESARESAASVLLELRTRVELGELELDPSLLKSDEGLAELQQSLVESEGEQVAWESRRQRLEESLDTLDARLDEAVLADPATLRAGRYERTAAELLLLIFRFEESRKQEALGEDPEIVLAGLESGLRIWKDGGSAIERLRARALELREALAAGEQALAEFAAPELDSIDPGEGHEELRAARRELRFAEAVLAYRTRRIELIEELRTAAVAVRDLDEEFGAALKRRAEETVRLSASAAAVREWIAQGELPAREDERDSQRLVPALVAMVKEEARRLGELDELGQRLASDTSLEAATRARDAQQDQLRAARMTYEEELSYGADVEAMTRLSDQELMRTLSQGGPLEGQIAAQEETLLEALAGFDVGNARIEELLSVLTTIESPHTQAEIERHPERAQELLVELTRIAETGEPLLPADAGASQEGHADLDGPRDRGLPSVDSIKSSLPTEAELAALEEDQISARNRLQYFVEFEQKVEAIRSVTAELGRLGESIEEQLSALIELEQRRYASALELQARISSGKLSSFGIGDQLARWVSREALGQAKQRRAELRAQMDAERTALQTQLERFDALLSWKRWAELGGEVAEEKVNLIAKPVVHVRAAATEVEDLKEYEQENLDHLSRELEREERSWGSGFLETFGTPEGNARIQRTLHAYNLELVNLARVQDEYRLAREAYQQLIELNLAYRKELMESLRGDDPALAIRLEDYQVVRYQAARVAHPQNRIAINSAFSLAYDSALPNPPEGLDLHGWANQLVAVEARLWGARRWQADLRYRLSRLGIESEISRYRKHIAQIDAQLDEKAGAASSMRARIRELHESRKRELERAGIVTALRIASIPILVMLALRALRMFTGQMRKKAARQHDDELSDRRRRLETLTNVLGTSITVLVWIVAGIYVLAALGLDVTPIIASASVMGLAIAFGAQALIKDYFSGFFILLENQYTVGDVVDLGGANGTVEHISLRVTVVRDLSGVVHYVPNGLISRVANKTKGWSRIVMEVRVGYGEDVQRVSAILEDVLAEMQADPAWGPKLLDDPQVLGVQDFGESALDLRLLVKTLPGQQWAVSRELRARIKARFDREGIPIPVPQRVVHHVSGEPAVLDQARGVAADDDS